MLLDAIPFPRISLDDIGFGCEFARGQWAICVKRLLEAKPITHADERYAQRAAEIVEHLAHEGMKFFFV